MNKPQCNTEKLTRGCAQLGIDLSAAQEQRLCQHLALLAKWNCRLNLTAITDHNDMLVRHLLDSLAIARFVHGRSLLDIGSGAGFPGIPLAVVHPHLEVTLLDSRGKRVEFLRHVCAALHLGNVNVVKRRVQDYRPAEKFDTLAARAFASFEDTLKASAGLHRPGGRLLAMKGRAPDIARLTAADAALAKRITIEKLNVPFLSAERHLILVELP